MQQTKKRSFLSIVIELLIAVVFLAAVYFIAMAERNNVSDFLALRGYHAPQAVANIAADDTMTPYAKKLFYVNHPQVDSKSAFSSVCPAGTEQTVVLGCYHSGEAGIYILGVDNSELNGIEQVTAAHETLHATYNRLGTSERNQLDGWLEDFYNHGLTDPVIKSQIASYRQTEPGSVVNEMDSLFGTEVATLPSNLSNYYSKYFTNRQAIVADYQSYQAAFTSRQDQITSDDQQLSTLNSQISANNSKLDSEQQTLNSNQKTLLSERSSNQIDAYNQAVPAYNQLVDSYNSLIGTTQGLIDQYNQIVNSRNSIVLEEQLLVQAISSSKQPISSSN